MQLENEEEVEDEVKMLSWGKAPSHALPGRELGADRDVEAGEGGGGGMNALGCKGWLRKGCFYVKHDDGEALLMSWRCMRAPMRGFCGCNNVRV
jgi:hypothetical protein